MASLDESELKERQRNNWKSVADGWRRRDELLRKGAAPVTERMLKLPGISPGLRLLDIASGTGGPAISAVKIVGKSGQVIGTDLVDEMLDIACEKATAINLEFSNSGDTLLNYNLGLRRQFFRMSEAE